MVMLIPPSATSRQQVSPIQRGLPGFQPCSTLTEVRPRLIKKAIEITPGIEPLYGTRDENLRLLEDGLHVTIDLRSDAIHVAGDETPVGRTVQIFADFDALRRSGVTLQNGELHGLLKLLVADPNATLRQLVDSGKQRAATLAQPEEVC
jgi:phosphate starvation-inducible protein PhoH